MTLAAAERFDRIAANFAASEVHSSSPSIRRLHEVVAMPIGASVVDVACGAGHVALSFAGRAGRIVGVDGAPSMLATFRSLAEARAVAVEAVLAMSDNMPFPPGSFDLAVSRLAPHHFPDVEASVREMARVVRPGGMVSIAN
jgi:ubiquinone/menaquinone biosynthesis C-methylase UbiE